MRNSATSLANSHDKSTVGILAYGSLIIDPGKELAPQIALRIKSQTPFPVEYGRLSRTRGGAPTLVNHPHGAPVSCQILVLKDLVSSDEARDMLWRRERRTIGSGEHYVEGRTANSVLVRTLMNHPCATILHYTDFLDVGKLKEIYPSELARKAIMSVNGADKGKDGITYLIDAMAAGIITPLTESYMAEILRLTKTKSLQEALEKARDLKVG